MKEVSNKKPRKVITYNILRAIFESEYSAGIIQDDLYNSFSLNSKILKSTLFYSSFGFVDILNKVKYLRKDHSALKEGETIFIDSRTSIPIKRANEHFRITKDISEADHIITNTLSSFDAHMCIILEDEEYMYFIVNPIDVTENLKIGDTLEAIIRISVPENKINKELDRILDSIGFNQMRVTYVGYVLEGQRSLVKILTPILQDKVKSIIPKVEYEKYICSKHNDLTIEIVDNVLSLMRSNDEASIIHGVNILLSSNYHLFPFVISSLLKLSNIKKRGNNKVLKMIKPLISLCNNNTEQTCSKKEYNVYRHLAIRSLVEDIRLMILDRNMKVSIEEIKEFYEIY